MVLPEVFAHIICRGELFLNQLTISICLNNMISSYVGLDTMLSTAKHLICVDDSSSLVIFAVAGESDTAISHSLQIRFVCAFLGVKIIRIKLLTDS